MKQISILIVACICILACQQKPQQQVVTEMEHYDLTQMKDSGVLVALTLNSSISYFDYRGEPMGFQYELAKQFAQSLGLKLELKIAKSTKDLVDMLLAGEGDLIAYPLPNTKEFKDTLKFCGEDIITHQVLVQRNGNKNQKAIANVTELIGKNVYAKPGKYLDRLNNLNKELGGGILIHEVANDSISIEDLIMQVSTGTIDYTLCDNDLARLNKTYYTNLDIHLPVSFDQRASWAVRKTAPLLAEAANQWHKDNQTSPAYKASTKRYFENSKRLPHGPILSIKDGKISHFDHLFKKYAPEIGWDWRIIASLAYNESNFDTTAVSWVGAKGLMQLMPNTALSLGLPQEEIFNPQKNVEAAVAYLRSLEKIFIGIDDAEERVKFVLAAYNAGPGHVFDARALASKYQKDPDKWEYVREYLLKKTEPEYYSDQVCRFGYCRGREPVTYVDVIMSKYADYRLWAR